MTSVMVTSKSIFRSKTFWLNLITLIVTLLTTLMGTEFIQNHPDWVGGFVMVINFMNIILRYLSDKPVTTFGNDVKRVPN